MPRWRVLIKDNVTVMSLRTKLILLALVPLLVVTGIFSAVTLHQGDILMERELQIFEQNLRRSKETALKDYVSIMRTAIEFVRQNAANDDEARDKVMALMQEASFSDDGYFYAYTHDGLNLVHAAQPALVGRDMYDFQDSSGNYLIQNLIRIADNGGGYYQYLWQQPSTGREVDKVGYVEQIEDWQWMFGTGLYIDDIAAEMRAIEAGVDAILTGHVHVPFDLTRASGNPSVRMVGAGTLSTRLRGAEPGYNVVTYGPQAGLSVEQRVFSAGS